MPEILFILLLISVEFFIPLIYQPACFVFLKLQFFRLIHFSSFLHVFKHFYFILRCRFIEIRSPFNLFITFKISQGFPKIPLPIITPSQFVTSIILAASWGEYISPLPMTGILTLFLTSLIIL